MTPGASHAGEGGVPSESARLEQRLCAEETKSGSFALVLLIFEPMCVSGATALRHVIGLTFCSWRFIE